MFILNGEPLAVDVPFTVDGIQFPANWLRLATLEEKQAIGITEEPDPIPPDTRFYWDHGNPKDHSQLVEQWCAQTRTTANTLLVPTDWMVIRQAEEGTEIPADIKTLRNSIRIACQEKIASITATEDTEALASYITGSSYNTWPALTDAAGTKESNIETADVVQETAPAKRSTSKRKQS